MGEPRVTVLRLRNVAAYQLPEVEALVQRAFDAQPLLPEAEVALEELRKYATDPALVVLVAREGEALTGLLVAFLPFTRLSDSASVYHLYTQTSAAREALSEEIVDLLRDLGVSAMETLSLTGREEAFERLFRTVAPVKRIGAMFRFDL